MSVTAWVSNSAMLRMVSFSSGTAGSAALESWRLASQANRISAAETRMEVARWPGSRLRPGMTETQVNR